MKKLTAALCVVLLMICVFVPGAAAAGPALGATALTASSMQTPACAGTAEYERELHPASITKVMTLGLACERRRGTGMI